LRFTNRDWDFYFNDIHKTVQPEVDLELTDAELAVLRTAFPFEFYWYPQLPRFFYYSRWEQIQEQFPEVYEAYKDAWEKYFAWVDSEAEFPYNLGEMDSWSGYNHEAAQRAASELSTDDFKADGWSQFLPDFQQQAVIDYYVDHCIRHIKTKSEVPDQGYWFAGVSFDMIEIWNEANRDRHMRPAGASSQLHGGITHEHPNLKQAWFHYLKSLKDGMNDAFPDRDVKFIYEPSGNPFDSFVSVLMNESGLSDEDQSYVAGDMVFGEHTNLDFLTDDRILQVGWYTMNDLGNCSSDIKGYGANLDAAGRIAQAGAWFNFYGMWQRLNIGTIAVEKVPMDLKLSRMFGNWDNLNDIPLEERRWDSERSVYRSPTSYADEDVLYSREPGAHRIRAVFRSVDGRVRLPEGMSVVSMDRVNGFWEPTGRAEFLDVESGAVVLKARPPRLSAACIIHLQPQVPSP